MAQFSNEVVATHHETVEGKILPAGNDDFVFLKFGQLYHLKVSQGPSFSIKKIHNSVIDLDNFELLDFDRDGDLDIVCNKLSKGKLYTYFKVDGEYVFSFDGPSPFNGTKFVHVQDFNGDGYDDAFVNNGVLISEGPNTYERILRTSASNTYRYDFMYFMDIDRDGSQDVFAQLNRNLFHMHDIGNGKISRELMDAFSNNVRWSQVINVNGEEEIIFQQRDTEQILRIERDSINFTTHTLAQAPYLFSDPVQVMDLDQDGTEEIVTTAYSQLYVYKYDPVGDSLIQFFEQKENKIDGIFHLKNNTTSQLILSDQGGYTGYEINEEGVLEQAFELKLGIGIDRFQDIDGDGNVDMIEYLGFQKGFDVKRYLGENNFAGTVNLDFETNAGEFEDYDADGDLDLVQEEGWYENQGDLLFGAYQERPPDTLPYPDPGIFFTKIALVDDLDGDGDLDIITYNNFGENIELLENANNEEFEDQVIIGSADDISGDLLYIDALDLDNDGDKDILMAAATGLVWFEQASPLDFQKAIKINQTEFRPSSIDVDDINLDGYPDIVIGTYENVAGDVNGNTQLCLGSSDGPLFFKFVNNDDGVHRVAFANVTEDANLEIIYLRENAMFWVELLPDSSLISHYIDGDFGINNKLIVTDVDGDGDEDIITHCTNCFAPIPQQDDRISYYINGSDFGTILPCPEGDIYLENQFELTEFRSQYAGCSTISGNLYIGELYAEWSNINSLAPLSGIKEVEGNLYLWYNNAIDDFSGLDSLKHVGGTFLIDGYKSTTLNGLHNLKTIGGDLRMRNVFTNAFGVGNLGEMESLQSIGGDIHIYQSRIATINWPSFDQDTVHGDVILSWLSGPPMEIEFLNQIETITGSLVIEDTQLDQLSALSHLKKIEDDFILSGNNYIYSLDTLHEDFVVDSLWKMFGNRFLNVCNVTPLCNHINAGKPVGIGGNGDDCDNIEDINCAITGISHQLSFGSNLRIYPQPASEYIHIDISINNVEYNLFEYRLFDLSGRQLKSGSIDTKAQISTQNLSGGVYILELKEPLSGRRLGIEKIIIE
jgi:hypothetical protein